MPRWNVLIVDDEALARSNLQLALADHPDWQVTGLAASAAEARVMQVQRPADLVLLDIQMPRQHGLAYAAELAALPNPPLVVFVTAHDEHALAAFEVHALDYLLKPLDDARLAQALTRAGQMLELRQREGYAVDVQALVREREAVIGRVLGGSSSINGMIYMRGWRRSASGTRLRWSGGGCPQRERRPSRTASGGWWSAAGPSGPRCRAAGCRPTRRACGRRLLHRATLSALEARLPPGEFLRVHRTALVRPSEIAALSVVGDGVYSAQLADGGSLPVSERHVEAVRALFT